MIINGDKAVAAAFVKARGEMNATVSKGAKGNFGMYATLAALTEATAPACANHGLAIIQEASLGESGVTVETWVIHESGGTIQFLALTMPLAKRDAQSVGSAITYARRYQLSAVCGIAPDDDDGQAATDAGQTRNSTPPVAASKRLDPFKAPHPPTDVEFTKPAPAPVDNPWDDLPEPPTDAEHSVISNWAKPQDALDWAQKVGACENGFEAANSLKKIVQEQFAGKLTKRNEPAVYLAFYRRQCEKLAAQPEPA